MAKKSKSTEIARIDEPKKSDEKKKGKKPMDSKAERAAKRREEKRRRKRRRGCIVRIVMASFVVISAIATYVTGDYFSRQYLDASLFEVGQTVYGLTHSNEKKLVKNAYQESDLTSLEGALRDRLLLVDDYALFDRVTGLTSSGLDGLSALLSEDDIDISKLDDFVYEGPNATDVTLNLTDRNLSALLDLILGSLPMMEEALENAGMAPGALKINVPQTYFISEVNPNFNGTPSVATGYTAQPLDADADTPPEEPEYIYSLKVTIKINLRLLAESMLNQSNPQLTKWVSWLVPKNYFITVETPLNYNRAPKIFINNMNQKKMDTAYRILNRSFALIGSDLNTNDLLDQVGDAIFPTLNSLNSQGFFNFKIVEGSTILNLDLIKTVLTLAKIEGVQSRDIYYILQTLTQQADLGLTDEQLAFASQALNTEFEKYLLKEDQTVGSLINGLMGADTQSTTDPDADPDADPNTPAPADPKAKTLQSATPQSGSSTDALLEYVDTANISRLYDTDITELDLYLDGEMLASLMRDVVENGNYDISGMTFDIVEVTLAQNDVGNTVLGIRIALSPRSILGESGDSTVGFLLNLLPQYMYIKANVNLYDYVDAENDEGDSTTVELNNADAANTQKILNIMSKFMGESLNIDELTNSAGSTVRSLIDEIKKLIGITFEECTLVGNPNYGELCARLDNIFALMVNQLELKEDDGTTPLADHRLQSLLKGMQVTANEDGTNNVLEDSIEFTAQDGNQTAAEYLDGLETRSNNFMTRLNQNYYFAQGKELDEQALIGGAIADAVSVESIDGKRMRNDNTSLNDLSVFLDHGALTHIISLKMDEGDTSLGAGIRLIQAFPMTSILPEEHEGYDVTGSNVFMRLLVEIDMKVYAADSYNRIPGLIPEYLYVRSITHFATTAANIRVFGETPLAEGEEDFDSTFITLNTMGGTDTDELIRIMGSFGGNAIDLDSIRSSISRSLRDSLSSLEGSMTDNNVLLMDYRDGGIMLPTIYDLMRKYVLTHEVTIDQDTDTRLSAAQLKEIIYELEYRDDTIGIPIMGNFYDAATNAYGDFDIEREEYKSHLETSNTNFELSIKDNYFLTDVIPTDKLFDSNMYSIASDDSGDNDNILDKFDGKAMRTNEKSIDELEFMLSGDAMVSIINSKISGGITDTTTTPAPSTFEEEGDTQDPDQDPADTTNAFEVFAIRILKDASGNLIFVIVIEAHLAAQGSTASAGDLMPERVYVTVTVDFKTTTATLAKQNLEDDTGTIAEQDKPSNIVVVNDMSKESTAVESVANETKQDIFETMLKQVGASFDFANVGNTLQTELINALASFEESIDIEYNEGDDNADRDSFVDEQAYAQARNGGIQMPTVYAQLNKMMLRQNSTSTSGEGDGSGTPSDGYDQHTISDLELKQLFENMDASSTLFLDSGDGNGTQQSSSTQLTYPTERDYEIAGITASDGDNDTSNAAYLRDSAKRINMIQGMAQGYGDLINLTTDPINQFELAGQMDMESMKDEQNSLGDLESIDIYSAYVYEDSGNIYLQITIRLTVSNKNMKKLMSEHIYLTTAIFFDGTTWDKVDADTDAHADYDFNNLSNKTHDNNKPMQETFENLLTYGFNSKGGFTGIVDLATTVMADLMNGAAAVSGGLTWQYSIADYTDTGLPWTLTDKGDPSIEIDSGTFFGLVGQLRPSI